MRDDRSLNLITPRWLSFWQPIRTGYSSAGSGGSRFINRSRRPPAKALTVRTPMCCAETSALKRTHPATEPIPEGWIPCAHLYPAHPSKDGMGRSQPFDNARHGVFQSLIETLGMPTAVAIKKRVTVAVSSEEFLCGARNHLGSRRSHQCPCCLAPDEGIGTSVAHLARVAWKPLTTPIGVRRKKTKPQMRMGTKFALPAKMRDRIELSGRRP